jgi:hypothetical protein
MEPQEHALLATTLRQLAETLDGPELSKSLDDFGFADLLAEEPRTAVSLLLTAMGRAGSMSGALQDVLRTALPAELAAGPAQYVVLPPIGRTLGGTLGRRTVTIRGLLLGQGPAAALLAPAAALLAPVAAPDGVAWARLASTEPGWSRAVAGLDPALGMAEIATGDVAAEVVLTGAAAASAWEAVAAAGRRALGYPILGAVSSMLDLAVDHARVRVQFGRPIGSFQAVRHRLADAYVAREGADAALENAWDADDEALAAMLAKSLVGRAARIAATQCQQVLAGLGFTAEHSFRHFLARATVLDQVLGSATELPGAIGARLVAAGAIPRLVQL